ncbi:MAG TPA: DUF6364 family protein [Verrucomicrobiales bacterium]|nr:DUF6364 family protein [Verrucomicrobiales bacterium]
MKTRVTITLDPEAHRIAKSTARARKTTVSGLIESLIRSSSGKPSSLVDSMIGSAELRTPAQRSDALFDALKAKLLKP